MRRDLREKAQTSRGWAEGCPADRDVEGARPMTCKRPRLHARERTIHRTSAVVNSPEVLPIACHRELNRFSLSRVVRLRHNPPGHGGSHLEGIA